MVTDMINSMHEGFLLVIIAFIAFALIAAANRVYTTDACHARDQASDIELAPPQQQAYSAGDRM